jgi:hypothetical protein
MCGTAPTPPVDPTYAPARISKESYMYIGGGILGTILILVLIVYFLRRV